MSGSNVVPFPAPAPPPPQATPLPPPVAAPVPPAPPAAQSAPALRLPPPSSPNESDDTAAFVAQFVKKQSPPAPPADAGDQTPPGQVPSAQVQLPPGQPGPSSPDESDDTAAFVAQFVHAQQAPATANMVAAQGSNPDKTAQAMATAAKLGLPVPAVEADPQHYADLAKLSDDRQVVARDPALQDWIKQDPTNAKLAIDDIAHLGVIGRLSRGLDEGRLQYQEGGVEAKNALAGPFGGPSAANINLLDAIKTQLQLAQGQDELADEARAQTAMAQRGGQPAMQGHLTERGFAPQAGEYAASVPGMGVYGDVAQGVGEFAGASKPIAEQAALAAGTYALGPLGAAYRAARMVGAGGEVGMAVAPALGRAAGMGLGKAAQMLGPAALTAMVGNQVVSSYGQIYDAQNGVKDANGQEIPETTKQLVAAGGAILAGGVMAAGGGAQLGRLLNLPKITFVHDLAVAAARVPTVQRAFGNLFAGAAKAGIVNALLGMGINGVQSVAPQIGMAVTSPNFETVFNNPDKYAALKKEIIEGWEDNLLLGAGLHVPAAGVSLMYDVGRASAAGRAAELWGGMMDAAAQSKTRMRAPASFEALMKAHSGDAVYVNGDALATYYQEIGSAPGAKNDPFAQVVPDMKDQLERAQLTGGVVEIPRASFAARLAGSNADYRLRPHIKITPDGMSAEEAQQFLKDNPDMFKGFDLESLAANGGEGPTQGHTFEVVNVAENSDHPENPLLTVRDETGQEVPVQAEDFNNFMQGRQATITRGEGGTGKVGEHANTLEVGDIVRTAEGAREAVRADVIRQLQAAGQTENQAKTNAALFVAFFGTMGRLMGLSPEAIYQAENIQIQREAAYVAGPGRYDDLDAAIDAIRAGRAGPSDREIYGPSLLEYLTEKPNPRTLAEAQNIDPRKLAGGLVDTGGNLRHMGAGDWHKEKVGRRKLINPEGRKLDDAALEAWEAGYFPNHSERPSIDDLLEAINNELRGEAVYPQPDADAQEKLHQRELVNYVDYLANEAGLDLKSMTNDQVRQAFAEFEGQAAPKATPDAEFDQTVYHGTPHQFDRFSTDKIGTGEGAQSFGWGLYFAGRKGIAEHYRNKLTASAAGARILVDGRPAMPGVEEDTARALLRNANALKKKMKDAREQLAMAQETVDHYNLVPPQDWFGESRLAESLNEVARLHNDISIMENLRDKKITVEGGRLYHVDVPEDNELLDWDKKFNEQQSGVQEKLKQIFASLPEGWEETAFAHQNIDLDDLTGEEIYHSLEKAREHDLLPMLPEEGERSMRDDEVVSKTLNQAGIPGLRYADAASRDKAEGQTHNYVIFDDSRAAIQQFEQRQGETKRGSIQFHEGLTLINLFKNADASTFPHEAAHLFLDIMDRAVRTPDATAEMRTDMGKLRKWLGVDEDENLRDNVAAHEKFARGFETYLKEGKPPSEELRGVFAKLSAWITRVYQRLKQSGQPINDEVRGIMDRMLATREAVDEAQAAMGTLNPTFKDAKMAGMSGTQFNLYVNKIAKKQDEIYDRVLARVSKMEEIKQTKLLNDERAAEMPHIEHQVIKNNPGARTWSYFAYAKDLVRPDKEIPRTKLSEAAVKAILGERIMGLPDGILARKKVQAGEGKLIVVHPDDVAAEFGYSTGKQMLEDMIAANIGRRNAEQATGRDMSLNGYVRHLTEQAMRDRLNELFGDPLHDGTIQQIAQEEAHKASTLDLISTDLRALAKRNGEPPPWSVEQAKAWVQQSFLKTSIRQAIKPGPYIKAEQKAARDAEIALLRGNVVDALKAKQRQMLAHIAAGEAQAFKKTYDKTVADWKNLGTTVRLPKIEPHFADQIHAILDTIGIPIARDADELRRGTAGQNLTDFIANRQKQGWPIDVPLFLHNVVGNQWLRPGQYDYRDFNTHDFMLTSDLITSLKHVGKEVNEILVGEKREDFQSRKAQMLEEAKDVPNIWRESGTRVPKGLDLVLTRGLLGTGRELKANLRRLENAMIMLGGRHGRAFVSAMVDALKISAARKDKYMEKVHQQFKDLYASMPKEWRERDDDKIDVPECPKNGSTLWSRESLRMVAMNMGNTGDRSNFEKMYKGEGWDAEAVYDALRSKKYLTADDWNYVQGVWNIMDEWKPVFDEFNRRLTGVGINYVKATPITTGHGQTLRGGYFPVMYDAVNANTAMMREKIEGVEGQESDKGPYGRGSLMARTYTGAMMNRTGYVGPLTYDPIAFANRFTDMIHDLAYRESIMNAWKLVNDPEIKAMMIDKLGPELQAKFNPWLRDLAGMSGKLDNRDRFMQNLTKWFRINSTKMYIGYNLITTALHAPTAYIHSLGETDKLAAIKNSIGLADMQKSNPRWQFILDNSLECHELAKTVDYDARQNLRGILRQDHILKKADNRWSYFSQFLLAKALCYSAGVVWETEYEKLMDQGMEHEEAAFAADRAVRVSHGGVSFMDQAEAFRSEGIMRNLLWFGGFWNSIFNKYVDTIAIGKRGVYAARAGDMSGAKEDFAKVLSNTFTYLLVPALITSVVRGYLQGDKPDNESFEKWYLENLLVEPAQPLPIINAVANMWLRHGKTPDVFGPEETILDIVAAGRDDYDAYEYGQYDPNILLHNVEAVGSVVPLAGAVPLTKSGEYLWDYGYGNLPQQTRLDVARGLLRGPPH